MIEWIEISGFPNSWLSDGKPREFVFWNKGEAVFGKVATEKRRAGNVWTEHKVFYSSRQSGIGDDYGYELQPSHFALIGSPA